MILGESGTGKESIAKALHDLSFRADSHFVALNCGALTASLVESELFGHTKGAFTGAEREKEGAFSVADGGTLFLDEIGELALEVQPKLLRALEAGRIRPVGATKEQAIQVRIVAATHRNLRAMVASGTFREDLYHRLVVFSVPVPPLRERPFEIPALAQHILDREFGERTKRIKEDALQKLVGYHWPGNVRELRNVLVRAGHGKPVIDGSLLQLGSSTQSATNGRLNATERERCVQAIRACRGNRTEAARYLRLSRSTFYDRVRKLGLENLVAEAAQLRE